MSKPFSALSLLALVTLPVVSVGLVKDAGFGSRNMPEDSVQRLQELLGALRALQWMHHTKHWRASGPNSYGDHLLFQRLYEAGGDPDIAKQIDGLGEKIVAYAGSDAVRDEVIWGHATNFVSKQKAKPGVSAVEAALASEREVQVLISKVYEGLKRTNSLSLGLDDFLMALADARETAIYLLQQRAGSA